MLFEILEKIFFYYIKIGLFGLYISRFLHLREVFFIIQCDLYGGIRTVFGFYKVQKPVLGADHNR